MPIVPVGVSSWRSRGLDQIRSGETEESTGLAVSRQLDPFVILRVLFRGHYATGKPN